MFSSIYRKDSVVSDSINYDILKKIQDIQNGKLIEPSLLGQEGNHTKTKDFIPPAIQKHLNGCCESKWPFQIEEQINGDDNSDNEQQQKQQQQQPVEELDKK